jgi:flagellar hook assembly protein FlgD
VAGHRIRTLLAEQREAGPHSIRWDGCDAQGRPQSSGTYLFVLEVAGQRAVRKITLLQ